MGLLIYFYLFNMRS